MPSTTDLTGDAPHGLRAARTERTRAAIRESALRLAGDRGYEATTMEDVAADAGVSRRTVFNYFPTKADLFLFTPPAPEPGAVDAFIAGHGPLLEDLAALLGTADPRPLGDADQFRTLRRLLRDNPALVLEIQSRVRLFHSVVRAAIARRLGAGLEDPRVIAASALSSSLQKAAVQLWAGAGAECTGQPADGGKTVGPPAPPAQPASVVEALDIVTATLREVIDLPAPTTAAGASGAAASTENPANTEKESA